MALSSGKGMAAGGQSGEWKSSPERGGGAKRRRGRVKHAPSLTLSALLRPTPPTPFRGHLPVPGRIFWQARSFTRLPCSGAQWRQVTLPQAGGEKNGDPCHATTCSGRRPGAQGGKVDGVAGVRSEISHEDTKAQRGSHAPETPHTSAPLLHVSDQLIALKIQKTPMHASFLYPL
jgi:hypothetical protein